MQHKIGLREKQCRLTTKLATLRITENATGQRQSVSDHLRGVATASRSRARKAGLERAGELIGLVHDLGKYSSAFQKYLRSATGLTDQDADNYVDAAALKGKIDHSTAGAQYVWRQLERRQPFGSFTGQLLGLCIASHHSGLIDCISATRESFGKDVFTSRMSKGADKTHLPEVLESAEQEILARAGELVNDAALLEDVKQLATRILVANKGNRICQSQQLGLMARFLFSSLIDADRTDTADFEDVRLKALRQSGAYTDWQILADRLEIHLRAIRPQHPVDELRREVSERCLESATVASGIYTLAVPTGGGKTLASLRFALHHALRRKLDRILYIVPFTSIIDQNAETVRNILERSPEERGRIVLEHHSNIEPDHQSWREKILTENWDAPVVFTTMVQFLDALFGAGTRGARRMHQLAHSVIVFDEVQTLPIKCVHVFNNAVNFLAEQCDSTVVLCTATQPLLDKVSEVNGAIRLAPQHELGPDREKLFDRLKRVQVKDARRLGGWTHAAVAGLAVDEVRRAGSCLVVVNTKKSAREVYGFTSALDQGERVHLSTHMCPAHRKERLAYIRERLEAGLPILCVSTQLIEAGVDVDFGVVIRALAGIDSIAQAAGRCNRNGTASAGAVHVVNLSEEKLNSLPEIQKAANIALRVLDDFREQPERYNQDLCGPKAMEEYYRYYFFERKDDMTYRVSREEIGHDDTLLNMLSLNTAAADEGRRISAGKAAPLSFYQAFSTAADAFKVIDAPTEGIVVPFGEEGKSIINDLCAAFDVEKQYRLLRLAQQFTVNVFPLMLQALKAAHAIRPVKEDVNVQYLDSRYYSDEYGLITEQITGMETLEA